MADTMVPDLQGKTQADTKKNIVAQMVSMGLTQAQAETIVNSNPAWQAVAGQDLFDFITTEVKQTLDAQAAHANANASAGSFRQADPANNPTSDVERGQMLRLAHGIGVYGHEPVFGRSGALQWGPEEEAALNAYQAKRGLQVTGEMDAATTHDITQFGNYLAGVGHPAPAGQPASQSAPEGQNKPPASIAAPGTPSAPTGASTSTGGTTVAGTASGATTGSTGTSTTDLGGTPNPDGLFKIPGGAEIWRVDGKDWYAVYRVPNTNTPLAWKIDAEDLPAIFGNKPPVPTKDLTGAQAFAQGPLVFGSSRLLANTSEHPFDAFVANFQTEAASKPWLRDPEILALTTRAVLENRQVTDAELSGTKWWQTHNAAERQWMQESASDPATAKQMIQDQRDNVRKTMIAAGIDNAPDSLVNLVADRITGGTWTAQYANTQITKIADPAAPGTLDPTTSRWVADLANQGTKLTTQLDNVDKVSQLVTTWLGPAYAAGWTQPQKEMWAGKLRNDPNGEQELTDWLKGQRMALYPEYKNPDLSYTDISAPWKSVWTQAWGSEPDETDPLFDKIVKTNDLGFAQQTLRQEGLKRGVSNVVNNLVSAVGSSDLGTNVRRVA